MNHMHKKLLSPGVWANAAAIPQFNAADIQFCLNEIQTSPAGRSRICFHSETSDPLQEMVIAFDGKSYVQASFHVDRDESIHFVEGFGKYVFFDEQGNVKTDIRLGHYESDLPFYCRIPGNTLHSLVAYSSVLVAHEVGTGPFERNNTTFPTWAKDFASEEEKAAYRTYHATMPAAPILPCEYDELAPGQYRANPGIYAVSRTDLLKLKAKIEKAHLTEGHLAIHQNETTKLHESFGIYLNGVKIQAHRYPHHDASFHILEGQAECTLFDENGQVKEVIRLGNKHSGLAFFVRIPKNHFYTLLPQSDYFITHESIAGPNPEKELADFVGKQAA